MKRVLLALGTLMATMSISFAAVDVNKATVTELDSVKGIGPAMSKRIIDERSAKGLFKDWADFDSRVKGIGEKSSAKLSSAGLTVNGQSMSGAPATKSTTKTETAFKKEGMRKESTAIVNKESKPVSMPASDIKSTKKIDTMDTLDYKDSKVNSKKDKKSLSEENKSKKPKDNSAIMSTTTQ